MKAIVECPNCGKRYQLLAPPRRPRVRCRVCREVISLIDSAAPSEEVTIQLAIGAADDTLTFQALEEPTTGQEEAEHSLSQPTRIGRFELRAAVGSGSYGVVYQAYDPVLRREVALKVPRAERLASAEAQVRFLREPKAAAQLRHPNIVPIYDTGSVDGCYYIASAFIEGTTLAAAAKGTLFDEGRATQIVAKLANALNYAHRQGIVHRDVKPANIMLDRSDEPYLMDFGLARWEQLDESLTANNQLLGTPAYMSPEQVGLEGVSIGPASDQYSLGVVLYELLTGQRPFEGSQGMVALLHDIRDKQPTPPRRLRDSITRDLETICLKALAKNPDDRYADCEELALDLQRWLADEPVKARRLSIAERAWVWSRKNRALASLAAVVVVLAVISSVAALYLGESRTRLNQALADANQKTDLANATAKELNNEIVRHRQAQTALNEKEGILSQTKAELDQRETGLQRLANELRQREQQVNELEGDLAQATDDVTSASTAAQTQRQLRDAAERRLLESLPFNDYLQTIVAADNSIKAGAFEAALKVLDEAKEEERAWEWHFLKSLAASHSTHLASDTIPMPAELSYINNLCEYGAGVWGPRRDGAGVFIQSSISPKRSISTHDRCAVSMSIDGRLVATASEREGLIIFEMATGKSNRIPISERETRRGLNRFSRLLFSPSGNHILVDLCLVNQVGNRSFTGIVAAVNLTTGETVTNRPRVPPAEQEWRTDARFGTVWNNGGNKLASWTHPPPKLEGKLKVWSGGVLKLWTMADTSGNEIRFDPQDGPTYRPNESHLRIVFSQDDQWLVACLHDKVRIVDLNTNSVRHTFSKYGDVLGCPDDRRFVTMFDNVLHIWDIRTGRKLPELSSLALKGYQRHWKQPVVRPNWSQLLLVASGPRRTPTELLRWDLLRWAPPRQD